MSAFLAGIASGAGDVYAQAAEEKRQQKIAQQKSVSDALLHQLQNDDTQTNPEKYATLGQYLRNTGVKEPDIQKILEASTYHHRMREEQSANDSGQITNPGTPLPGSPDVAAKTVTPPAVHFPNGQVDAGTGPQGTPSQLPAVAGQESGLPPLPQYQAPAPKTQGDYKTDNDIRKLAQTNVQALALKSAEDRAAIQAKIDAYEQTTGQKMDPRQVAMLIGAAGKNVRTVGSELTSEDVLKNDPEAVDVHGARIIAGNGLKYKQLSDNFGNILGYVGASVTQKPAGWFKDDSSTTGWSQAEIDPYGRVDPARVIKNQVPPPGLLERFVNGMVPKLVPQPDGSVQVQYFPTSAVSGRQVPNGGGAAPIVAPMQGASPAAPVQNANPASPLPTAPGGGAPQGNAMPPKPPAMPVRVGGQGPAAPMPGRPSISGATVGGKSLSPEDKMKAETNLRNVNTTIGRIKYLENNVDKLTSLVEQGKIKFATDPHQGWLTAIANANIQLTPEEADLAAVFSKMSEDIFQTRQTLGATAIPRSTEGMQVIEAQKGIIGQQPDVMKRILEQTNEEFHNLKAPLSRNAKTFGYGAPEDVGEPPEHQSMFTKKPAPPVGTVLKGHIFKGGDPAKQENWEPVKGGK